MADSPSRLSHTALDDLERIAQAPGERVQRLEIEDSIVWIKRIGATQATGWHRLQGAIAALAPHPMLRVTVDTGGPSSLRREARRLEEFASAGFLVPPILLSSERALVLGDLGPDLGRRQKGDPEGFRALLPAIGKVFGQVHSAGLAHGRPSRRDLVERAGQIGFLDFEENPAGVMPIAVAQARDLLLLFVDLARSGLATKDLDACWQGYRPHMGAAQRDAVEGPVRLLCRAGALVMPVAGRFSGRDLKAPISAARFLRAALQTRS